MSLVEILIAMGMSGAVVFLLADIMEVGHRTQAQHDVAADANILLSRLHLVLDSSAQCDCNFRGMLIPGGSAPVNVPATVHLFNADCTKTVEDIAVPKNKPGKGVWVKSVSLTDFKQVSDTILFANLELAMEKVIPHGATGVSSARRKMLVTLRGQKTPDHQLLVMGCGNRGRGDVFLGQQSFVKPPEKNQVEIDPHPYIDAKFVNISVRGARMASAGQGSSESFGSDLESMEILLDLKSETYRGTYLFAGGPQGSDSTLFGFQGALDGRSMRALDGLGAPCFWMRNDPVHPVCYSPDSIYNHLTARTGTTMTWRKWSDHKLLVTNLSDQVWAQAWTLKYYR